MTFFYDLNKRLAALASNAEQEHIAESKKAETVAQSPLTQALNEAGQRRGGLGEPDIVNIPGPAKGTKPSPKAITKGADREYYKAPGLGGTTVTKWRKKTTEEELDEAGYSAKAARAGKDIGKPGKAFSKIAKSAGERYGSKEAGERVAGAVLNKLRHPKESVEEAEMDESALQAYLGDKKYGKEGMKALQKAGREHAGKEKMARIRAQYDKMDESDMEEGMFGFGMPKTSVSNDRLMVQGDQKAGNKVMVALQKANPQLAAQGKHSGASGPDGYQYLGIQFATPQLAQQAAQALQGGMEEGNAFTDQLRKTPKGSKFKLGNKTFKDTSSLEEADPTGLEEGFKEMDAWLASREKEKGTGKFDKRERTLPGGMKATTYTRRHEDDVEDDSDAPADKGGAPKRRGRPKGKDKGPERVTAKSYKYKAGRPQKTAEDLDVDGVMMTRPSNMSSEDVHDMEGHNDRDEAGEFGAEGDYVKNELHTMVRVARDLEKHLRDNEDLPTWCIGKLSQAKGMVVSVMDYIMSEKERGVEASTGEEGITLEKAPPGAKAERMVKHIKKSLSKDGKLSDKDKAIAYATTWKAHNKGQVEEAGKPDFLDLDKDGNKAEPMKSAAKQAKEKKVDETTVTGSVATAPSAAPKASKGMQFGKGVYEGFNNQVESMITESIQIESTMEECGDGIGQGVTIQASGDDAAKLMALLKLAGLGEGYRSVCPTCGSADCSCEELDENSPDWPTNTEKLDAEPNLRTYSGGLNGPKSTGQTTVPVIASQLSRQASMEESVELERNLFKTWKNYKG